MKIENSEVSSYSNTTYNLKHQTISHTQFHYGQKEGNSVLDIDTSSIKSDSTQLVQRMVHPFEESMSYEDRFKKNLIEILLKEYFDFFNTSKLNPLSKKEIQDNNQELIGLTYVNEEQYHQKQTIDFKSSVKITTQKGSFETQIQISYTKELYEVHSSTITIGEKERRDPLIINYDEDINPFENISNLKFEFDLTNNGENETIPYLKKGAGYLALDKNQNGKIDKGSELFGTILNDGFKELKQYDSDKNNWIDENDKIFASLKIWQIDEEGNNQLLSLIDNNIGAIYLGEVQSDYKHQDKIDQLKAVQKSNGIFVKEDSGKIGVINSIDIAT